MAREYWRPANMLYPVPAVMVSCMDEEGRANIMTAAWAGTLCSDPVMVSVAIRPERYSHDIIERTGEFVLNLTTQELAFAADFCGVRSGRDIDKFQHLRLTRLPSKHVRAPGIAESPVCLECRVTEIRRLGVHDLFIAEVAGGEGGTDRLFSRGVFCAGQEAGKIRLLRAQKGNGKTPEPENKKVRNRTVRTCGGTGFPGG